MLYKRITGLINQALLIQILGAETEVKDAEQSSKTERKHSGTKSPCFESKCALKSLTNKPNLYVFKAEEEISKWGAGECN